MMKPIYIVILAVVVAAAAFYGGMMYQRNQIRANFANGAAGGQFVSRFGGQGGFGGGMMARSGMTPVRGQIVSQNNNSITVKLQDGSSKIVNLTSQTRINKLTTGSVSDLKTGTNVTAIGPTNSDGSVTANDVNIGNGTSMMRSGGPATQGSPSGSQ